MNTYQYLAGTACESCVLRRCCACLPSPKGPNGPEITAHRLQPTQAFAGHNLAPRVAQELVKRVATLATALVDQRPPDVSAALASPKLKNLSTQCSTSSSSCAKQTPPTQQVTAEAAALLTHSGSVPVLIRRCLHQPVYGPRSPTCRKCASANNVLRPWFDPSAHDV